MFFESGGSLMGENDIGGVYSGVPIKSMTCFSCLLVLVIYMFYWH